MADMYPQGRYGEVDAVAAAAEFLLSDASSWITGQVLGVDGGLSSLRKS
ncbi:2-(S)-hydroxypropyl-CoM dehydrogenase [Rosistilla ulvae]|uniref:2-(S)-hydroxypropyl-CoM dehydrogenase n=1 Tax=Rosistilla ulvae TaxID=1930277 RepID=A0A517LU13_9BACT|nr:2-(S)-hydroxypropyl-CoM dehydrogenase [Rosistilla ulvae]